MTIILSDVDALSVEAVAAALDDDAPAAVDAATARRMDAAFAAFSARSLEAPIYGLNTGLGPMVVVPVARENLERQQRELILSHASGVGPPLTYRQARATMLARARSMTLNRSAVRARLPQMITELMNAGAAPAIPRHGGVGASGDLVQLAHLGLFLIGEGDAVTRDGREPAAAALKRADLTPLDLQFRDGLGIVNGVSAMTGVGLVALLDARRVLDAAFHLAALMAEIVGAGEEPYSAALSSVKRASGQNAAATRLRTILDGGAALTRHADDGGAGRPLQEHYSIRCTPQILGAILNTLDNAERALVDELNSVSDNPVFFPDDETIVHGGNFHGEPIAMAMDAMKVAVVKCAMLMERQLNFLLHDGLNGLLPAFLNDGAPGVGFGFQGAQFTATSTTAHSQSLAFPMSVHSIPCNRDNQDIVSMGCDAALMAAETVDNAASVAAFLSLAAGEAVRILELDEQVAPRSRRFLESLREGADREKRAGASFSAAIETAKRRLFPTLAT